MLLGDIQKSQNRLQELQYPPKCHLPPEEEADCPHHFIERATVPGFWTIIQTQYFKPQILYRIRITEDKTFFLGFSPHPPNEILIVSYRFKFNILFLATYLAKGT